MTSCVQCWEGDSKAGTAWVPKNIHMPGQSTATPQKQLNSCTRATLPPSLGGSGGQLNRTVQISQVQAGSCSGLDETQYNEDANKRICSLPTHCLPAPPGRISDAQPVVPMERKGTSEQRVHAATHPHTAVLSLQAQSQVWVFLFFPASIFQKNLL